jgi:hypothetical protein
MRFERRAARLKIIAEANAIRHGYAYRPYTMRHLYRAVCVVRRHDVVKPKVLLQAGFNVKARYP